MILIADDDLDDRLLMAQTFKEIGFDGVEFAEDGTIVIDYLLKQGAQAITLIILDLNMPRLNGTQTLRMLKTDMRFQEIPVIIFSTSVNAIERDICMGLGAQEYITKPLRYSEYLETCRKFHAMATGCG